MLMRLLAVVLQVQLAKAVLPAPVREVHASVFDPASVDIVVDVRNRDEYQGTASASHCSVGRDDPKGCLYGHIPEAIWLPQLHLCGTTRPWTRCSEAQQWDADVALLGSGPTAKGVAAAVRGQAAAMTPCLDLRIAFVCHSGVRSRAAAQRYMQLLHRLFPHAYLTENAVNVAGGTQAWFNGGRLTVFGMGASNSPRGINATCAQLARRARAGNLLLL